MPYQTFVSSNVSQLAGLLKNASNNKSIYLFKDSNGVIQAFESENQQNTNNTGYPYQFLNGDVVYSTFPISSINQIAYDFPYTGLGSLFTSNLVLWYDAKEPKNINASSQKILSKGYSTNEMAVENTVSNSFLFVNNAIDLSSGANLETVNTIAQKQYWTLCMVLTCPSQTLTNHTIFQHNDISVRISGPRLAPDGINNTYMIATHMAGVFKQGITFKPTDPTFKYIVYCNQSGNLLVNNNSPSQVFTGSYAFGSSFKVYVGQDSTATNNSLMKLHELMYYTSTANDIGLTYSNFTSYLTSKWSLTTWVDNFNIIPILNPLTISTSTMYWQTGSSSGNNLLNFLTSTTIFTPNGGANINASPLTFGGYTAKAGFIDSPGGSNIYYNCSDNSLFTSFIQDAFTIICIVRATADGRFWVSSPIGGQLNNMMHGGGVISFSNGISNLQYNQSGNVNLTTGNFYIVSATFSGGQYNNGAFSVRINGASAYNAYNGASTGGNSAITQNYIAWSVAGGGQSQCWAFFFAKSVLPLATIQKLEGLMVHNNFVNPTTSNILDASHPYKSAPPASFA